MNFTTGLSTTASETTYDRFRPYYDLSRRHSREKTQFKHNQAGLIAYALKRPFVGNIEKIEAAKPFKAYRLKHYQLILRLLLTIVCVLHHQYLYTLSLLVARTISTLLMVTNILTG